MRDNQTVGFQIILEGNFLNTSACIPPILIQLLNKRPSMHVCVLSHFCCVQLCAVIWTVSHQAPLSMGFSRQEYWSGFSCPPPGDLPDSGVEPESLTSPALAGLFFTTSASWEVRETQKIFSFSSCSQLA